MKNHAASRFEVELIYDEIKARRGEAPQSNAAHRESIRRRLILCGAGLAVVFATLGLRTTQLALDTPAPVYAAAPQVEVEGPARIEDATGRALAVTLQGFGVAINGAEVWDPVEAARAVSSVLPETDTGELEERLAAGQRVTLRRVISQADRDAVVALGLPGVSFPETDVRAYPQGRLFSHVIGYQIPGRGGVTGLEAAMSSAERTGPQRTTLNIAAQTVLLSELVRVQTKFRAKAAWGVLMNAKTGDVAAMASLPDFDPNVPGASPAAARRNRAVSDNYELGSAFKALTVAMALDEGFVSLTTPVDVTSPLQVGDWSIEDYSDKGSVLTVEEVLSYSSNIGTGQLALILGEERFVEAIGKFGLTERLETSLPETRAPALPQTWGPAELATVSYGHGIAVSPLHLTASFAALVNGGALITPRFLESDPVDRRQIISAATSRQMRQALRAVVTKGTGGKAEAPGYYVIGKTATADKAGVGGYDDNGPLISSFIGAFPGYDPDWVLLVSLDEPQAVRETFGYATAGWTAAPAFRRMVERLAPVLEIMPVGDDVATDGFMSVLDERADARGVMGFGSVDEETR
ncbi:MAG: penicillin-binding protein 2 [Pseudomonadota bacterium]